MKQRVILPFLAFATLLGCTRDSGTEPDLQAPAVTITAPASSASIGASAVTVTGRATDNERVTRISYQVNGAAEQDVTITAGPSVDFTFEVDGLAVGANSIAIYAEDAAGNRGQAQVSVTRADGAGGAAELFATVRDASTDLPVEDVAINVTSGAGTITGAVTYEQNGLYRIELPAGTGYTVQFSKAGYLQANYSGIDVSAAAPTHLEALLFISAAASGTGDASGIISDALTGQGVSAATLTLRSGLNATSGATVATATTGSNGAYAFSGLAAGYYTAAISKAGYSTAHRTVIVLGGQATANQNAAITPEIPAGQVRIILTWGQSPADLDAHLTGPLAAGTGRFHVFWANMRYDHDATTYAALDRDDVSSYGPETMTIYQQTAGEYVFSVHDYTNRSSTSSRALGNSGAKVTVQRGGSQEVHTYHVPAGVGTLWRVFKIEAPGARPVPINTLSNHTDPGTVQIGPRGGAGSLLAAPKP